MRLNLGCGHEPLDGWGNVDLYADEADIKGDIRQLDFADVDEVMLNHVLEHFSWRETQEVLTRIHGWMSAGGKLTVEVPDMQAITVEAMKNPDWIRYVYGSQEHEGEYHRAGFTLGALAEQVTAAGFSIMLARRIRSSNGHRPGMPCIRVVAAA